MNENNIQENQMTSSVVSAVSQNKEVVSNIAKKPKKKDELDGLKIVDNPSRSLPKIINELLEKNFSIVLTKNGYLVEGFYGLSHDTQHVGFAFGQETTDNNVLVFFDAKGHKHVIKSFEDLVRFNSLVWGVFYKVSEEYKKPNPKWFLHMLELGALNITPNSK